MRFVAVLEALQQERADPAVSRPAAWESLPEPARRYLQNALVDRAGAARGVQLSMTGSMVANGRRIDLGYSDDDLVLWYSWVDVYLLTPVPPIEDILYILP